MARTMNSAAQVVITVISQALARAVMRIPRRFTAVMPRVNAMAQAHVSYLLGRIDLFLDLELLEVDDAGFWKDVYDEHHQPAPNWELPAYARPVYGELPRGLWYSHPMRRMLEVPVGQTTVYATDRRAAGGGDRPAASGGQEADPGAAAGDP